MLSKIKNNPNYTFGLFLTLLFSPKFSLQWISLEDGIVYLKQVDFTELLLYIQHHPNIYIPIYFKGNGDQVSDGIGLLCQFLSCKT